MILFANVFLSVHQLRSFDNVLQIHICICYDDELIRYIHSIRYRLDIISRSHRGDGTHEFHGSASSLTEIAENATIRPRQRSNIQSCQLAKAQ